MKFIGQFIQDFIARFRNDVYLEDLAEQTQEFSVMVDADGKLTKSTHPSERSRLQVRNDEGSTIPAGAPLYSKGEIGGSERILVGIASAGSSAKMPCIGIAEAEMNTTSTQDNFAISQGVYNTNISGFTGLSVGDILYVGGVSAPYLTQNKSDITTQNNFIQNVGIVLKTNGTICQGLLVSAIGRSNDVSNLNNDHIFLGVGNQAQPTALSSISLGSFDGFGDNEALTIGDGNDLQLYHNGTNSNIENFTGTLQIVQNADDGNITFRSDDGSGGTTEYFRLDGALGYTRFWKHARLEDDVELRVGTGNDLLIYHDGSNNYIQGVNGDLYIQNGSNDKDIILRSDDGSGGQTAYLTLDGSAGYTTAQKNIRFADSVEAQFGGIADLTISHNGSNSIIANNTGNLQIKNRADDGRIIFESDDGSGGITEYFRVDGGSEKTIYTKPISLLDSVGLQLGTGTDAQMYHTGSEGTFINYTGNFRFIQSADDADISFHSDDGSGGVETYFFLDGSLSSGNPFTVFPDESRLAIGDDADMIIYHNGSSSFITQKGTGDLYITNSTNDKDIIFQSDDGAGGLANYFRIDGSQAAHDGSASTALYTTWIDNSRIALGTDRDLHLHHTGSNSKITNYTGNLEIINNADDGDIKFSSDDGSGGTTEYFRLDGGDEKVKALKQLEVTGGVELTNGNLNMPDNSAIRLGSSTDLQIYHDGSNSFIVDAGTGDLLNYFSNEWKVIKYGSSETCIEATSDGSVDLYYDNSKKLETTSTGVEVTGDISLTGSVQKQIQVFPMNFVDDLGTDKHFMPFVTNTEQTVNYQEEAAMVMPADGRVVSVTVHYAQMHGSDGNITVGIETSPCGQAYTNPWTVEETETIAASVADDHHVFHFAFDNAKHFESTDKMAISIQQSTAMQNAGRFFWVTAVIEYDWSTFLGGTSAEYTTTP